MNVRCKAKLLNENLKNCVKLAGEIKLVIEKFGESEYLSKE